MRVSRMRMRVFPVNGRGSPGHTSFGMGDRPAMRMYRPRGAVSRAMQEPERIARLFVAAEPRYPVRSRVADVARSRRKIERPQRHSERVLNVRGAGYKLVPRSADANGGRRGD